MTRFNPRFWCKIFRRDSEKSNLAVTEGVIIQNRILKKPITERKYYGNI